MVSAPPKPTSLFPESSPSLWPRDWHSSVLMPADDRGEEEAIELLTPADLEGFRNWIPSSALIMGERGRGKTFAMTVVGNMLLQAFRAKGLRHRIFSNYHVRFADIQHPDLLNFLLEFPPWSHHSHLLVDELDGAFSSALAATKKSRNFAEWQKQIRKTGVSMTFTTQYAVEIDKRILRQIDCFIRPTIYRKANALLLQIYDYWGNHTGIQTAKTWPIMPWDPPDEEIVVFNILDVFKYYNSGEIIPPLHSASRDKMVYSQWKAEIEEEMAEAEKQNYQTESAKSPVSAPDSGEITTIRELVYRQGDEFLLLDILNQAKKIDQTIKSNRELKEHVQEYGYDVVRHGSTYMAVKRK